MFSFEIFYISYFHFAKSNIIHQLVTQSKKIENLFTSYEKWSLFHELYEYVHGYLNKLQNID